MSALAAGADATSRAQRDEMPRAPLITEWMNRRRSMHEMLIVSLLSLSL